MSTTSFTKSILSPHGTPSPRLNEGAVTKDVRAHEHARHRTRERQEYVLTKERKHKATVGRVLGLKVTHAHGTKLVRKLSMESWDGEGPEKRSVQQVSPDMEEPEHERGVAPSRDSTSSFTELTLGDLISKPCLRKAKQLDFEMIPPIRAVIALDDVEADEQWEYITRASLNDGFAWKGRSYAQAVANTM